MYSTAPREYFLAAVARDTDECIRWPFGVNANGYGRVTLGGVRDYCHVHALLTLGPRPFVGAVVRHGECHDPSCFNPRHLSWGTQAENIADIYRDGGRTGPSRVLSNEDATSIRVSTELGRVLAERYGVSHSLIKAIRQGRRYR